MKKKIFITGAAGFIANQLTLELLKTDCEIICIDDLNNYYSTQLKIDRLKRLGVYYDSSGNNKKYQSTTFPNLTFIKMKLENKAGIDQLFMDNSFDYVIHLAGQAGVRYSISNPYCYMESNILGFLNILEACRYHSVKHLIYASSSSVYGLNNHVPFTESEKTDQPVSLYAAFKKSNELMAHAYSALYSIPTTGFRFFTVYGPWGRPDMSPMLFSDAIKNGKTIKVFNNGNLFRDFTYIDDIVSGILCTLECPPRQEECTSGIPTKIYNIGCGHRVPLMDFISELERQMGKEVKKEFLPMQKGDVYQTYADSSRLFSEHGYKPHVQLHEGLKQFVSWYNDYYQ